ncbi:MAG: glycerol-3-phosphate 1-O-acyltransferase PlsY [Lachnospiraceae bacterium]|nr:glycerol-3-phosphate 1-O-acyltransferase PlsY [Lachnospiraceae bacterium]
MDVLLKAVICFVIGYGCGNISTAWLIGKIKKVDFRKVGSGNLGTTNVMRTLGKKYGILTYVGDFIKVVVPVVLVEYVIFADEDYNRLLGLVIGLGAVMGHVFPFWLKFKGGKGVAVMSAVMAVYNPWLLLIGWCLFWGIVLTTKYVSLGSMAAAVLFPIFVFVHDAIIDDNPYIIPMMCITLCYSVLVIYMHRANIQRILNGTENKIGKKKEAHE